MYKLRAIEASKSKQTPIIKLTHSNKSKPSISGTKKDSHHHEERHDWVAQDQEGRVAQKYLNVGHTTPRHTILLQIGFEHGIVLVVVDPEAMENIACQYDAESELGPSPMLIFQER